MAPPRHRNHPFGYFNNHDRAALEEGQGLKNAFLKRFCRPPFLTGSLKKS
jgi:hypothetical protein